MIWSAHRPAPRMVALGWVLLLHALLWLALAALREAPAPAPPVATPGPEPVWLRWVAPEAERRADNAATAYTAAPGSAPQRPRPALPQPTAAQAAITWAPASTPAPAPTASASAAEPLAQSATEPAASAPPRLVLDLPRQPPGTAARRNPALEDPRSNTARATLESRIAAAVGSPSGAITEERLSDGTLRLRRGNQCVLVRPSRQAAIDPFNESVSLRVRGVESCN